MCRLHKQLESVTSCAQVVSGNVGYFQAKLLIFIDFQIMQVS